jgi:hypothetical protein
MYYECKSCHHEEYRGCLPGTTFGLLMPVSAGISLAMLLIAFETLCPNGIGWWWLLIGPVGFLLAIVPGSLIVYGAIWIAEWLFISIFRCTKCGSHRFCLGKNRGFGL